MYRIFIFYSGPVSLDDTALHTNANILQPNMELYYYLTAFLLNARSECCKFNTHAFLNKIKILFIKMLIIIKILIISLTNTRSAWWFFALPVRQNAEELRQWILNMSCNTCIPTIVTFVHLKYSGTEGTSICFQNIDTRTVKAGLVAQWLERWTNHPKVACSKPMPSS